MTCIFGVFIYQDGEGVQPLLDVLFPDVSAHGQGFHLRSFVKGRGFSDTGGYKGLGSPIERDDDAYPWAESHSHWQKLTLWQVFIYILYSLCF